MPDEGIATRLGKSVRELEREELIEVVEYLATENERLRDRVEGAHQLAAMRLYMARNWES